MRILANYGYKTNGDSYSVTFETMWDVPAALATQAVEDPVQVPRPVARAHANGNGSGRKPVIKDPFQPASPKQLRLIQQLARQKGAWLEGLEDLTKGEASRKIDELMAIAA